MLLMLDGRQKINNLLSKISVKSEGANRLLRQQIINMTTLLLSFISSTESWPSWEMWAMAPEDYRRSQHVKYFTIIS